MNSVAIEKVIGLVDVGVTETVVETVFIRAWQVSRVVPDCRVTVGGKIKASVLEIGIDCAGVI